MSKRVVFMFKPRFADLVKNGSKKQTIRPGMKRRIETGMIADCREWDGKPYRSKQIKLREGIIFHVRDVMICNENIYLKGSDGFYPCSDLTTHDLSRSDGFYSWSDMRDWFQQTHGLPFIGRMVLWG